jgi:hypothetical protein
MKKFIFILFLFLVSCKSEYTLQEIEKEEISPTTLTWIYIQIKDCQDLGRGYTIHKAMGNNFFVYCTASKGETKVKEKFESEEDKFKSEDD